jgi:hypothetical protein
VNQAEETNNFGYRLFSSVAASLGNQAVLRFDINQMFYWARQFIESFQVQLKQARAFGPCLATLSSLGSRAAHFPSTSTTVCFPLTFYQSPLILWSRFHRRVYPITIKWECLSEAMAQILNPNPKENLCAGGTN